MLNRASTRGLGDAYLVRAQDPVAVSGWKGNDAPEIDVAVVANKPYRRTATASDAFAVVEVSDTAYEFDRRDEIPSYARAGVPSWIVDIPKRRVEFYGSTENLRLEHGRVFTIDDTSDILGVSIRVADLFAKS